MYIPWKDKKASRSPFRRRDRTEVIADILTEALHGASKTRLVYRSNLNFRLLTHYITFLVNRGLIEKEEMPEGCYRTTDKGAEFLIDFRKVSDLVYEEPRQSQKRLAPSSRQRLTLPQEGST